MCVYSERCDNLFPGVRAKNRDAIWTDEERPSFDRFLLFFCFFYQQLCCVCNFFFAVEDVFFLSRYSVCVSRSAFSASRIVFTLAAHSCPTEENLAILFQSCLFFTINYVLFVVVGYFHLGQKLAVLSSFRYPLCLGPFRVDKRPPKTHKIILMESSRPWSDVLWFVVRLLFKWIGFCARGI